ncbi:amidase [Roseomonas populi]|uniref:Amidase n=1 Tax=Roseomonas populi TaxID=3121582 RepID=A0ABT1X6P8_9PROT|nr:amidase [Roseomonas pecuniae]MCR0983781.1 amidase [Roseomonas pecuniae]
MTLMPYVELSDAFRRGRTTPLAVMEQVLERLDAIEPGLHAFVYLERAGALARAAESAARWRAGRPLSPIDGMAIGVKDIIETADMPTGQGSPAWAGTRTGRDAASVQALREAGAIILGKTTTTEFASTEPFHDTRNPHDPARTPGGSSSGSAAAVGAGILPAAIGSQVVGSTLRPASYCGCVGFKPSFGALNRGGSFDHLSQSCVGLLAASPEDAWCVAAAIARRVGGDPGHAALAGPETPPDIRRPARLGVLRTAGWARATPGAQAAFEAALDRLRARGAVVVQNGHAALREAEDALRDALPLTFRIFDWEWLWPLGAYERERPGSVSAPMRQWLERARTMSPADYGAALAEREAIRGRYAALRGSFDAVIALGATGAAPAGLGWTGDPAANVPASLLGIPAITLPLLEDEGLPLGLQLLGQAGDDAALISVARSIWQEWNA